MKNTLIQKLISILSPSLILILFHLPQAHSAQLVIIIDDIGNNYALGNAMVELPAPLTLAFLPHTPYAKKLANKAHALSKEVMLHAPMENTVAAPLGPGALTQNLTETEFKQTLEKSIESIPHTQGINNHMGSLLTQNSKAMGWVMDVLKERQLYFVDSLTSAKSVAYHQAKNTSLPVLKRHVFLDNDKSDSALEKQWQQAIRVAKRSNYAVLIGHPYKESHAFLSKKIPSLATQNIQLIPVSRLLLQQAWQGFEQTVDQPSNRYLLNNKNNQIEVLNENTLISHNSNTGSH